jgi:hypothetical protein
MREHDFSYRAIADALRVGPSTVYRDVFGELRIRSEAEEDSSPVPHGTPEPVTSTIPVSSGTPDPVNSDSPVPDGTPDQDGTPETWTTEPPVPHGTPEPEKRIRGKDGKIYLDKQPKHSHATKAKSSPADRQLAQVINLLMNHAPQWGERHWQAFLEVVQSLRGSKEPAPATE